MKQDDEWVAGQIRIPRGARLGSSTATPGADSALLFNKKTGKTMGPAEVRVGASDSDLAEKVVGLALTATATLVVTYGPEIKDWVRDDVIPSVKAKWHRKFKAKDGSRPLQGEVNAASEDGAEADAPVENSAGPADLEAVHSITDVQQQPRPSDGRLGHGKPEASSRPM